MAGEGFPRCLIMVCPCNGSKDCTPLASCWGVLSYVSAVFIGITVTRFTRGAHAHLQAHALTQILLVSSYLWRGCCLCNTLQLMLKLWVVRVSSWVCRQGCLCAR